MSKITEEQKFLTPPQVAEYLGVSHIKILRFIISGELPAIDLASNRGGRPRWHVSREDLDDFLKRRASTPPLPPIRKRRKRNDGVISFY